VIGVEDSGGSAEKVGLFAQSLGVTYPLFHDESQQIAQTFAVKVTSTTYIISADFVVRDRVEDGTSKAYLEKMWARYGQGAP
jgi:peroxiredoxin